MGIDDVRFPQRSSTNFLQILNVDLSSSGINLNFSEKASTQHFKVNVDFYRYFKFYGIELVIIEVGLVAGLTALAGLVLLVVPRGDGEVSVGAELGASAPAAAGYGQTWGQETSDNVHTMAP